MSRVFGSACRFLAIYAAAIAAVWGCVEAYTYFTGDNLRVLLAHYWSLFFYGGPFLLAVIATTIGPGADRAAADMRVDNAREKVRDWGRRVAQQGGQWDDECWHLLGHALKYSFEAIEANPDYQRPWNILADVLHRIGKTDLANEALQKAFARATPGPNKPGRFYREVEANLRSGYPFDRRGGLKRESAPAWFDAKYARYLSTDTGHRWAAWRYVPMLLAISAIVMAFVALRYFQ